MYGEVFKLPYQYNIPIVYYSLFNFRFCVFVFEEFIIFFIEKILLIHYVDFVYDYVVKNFFWLFTDIDFQMSCK